MLDRLHIGRLPGFDGAAAPNLRRVARYSPSLGEATRAARRAAAFLALVLSLTLGPGAAVASAAPEISIQNLDEVPFADRLAFNRIQAQGANGVHDTAAVRIHNEGPDPLIVSGLDISGPWQRIDTAALPAAVSAGGSLDVRLKFTAASIGANAGRYNGSLRVTSNDADEPARTVQLAGFWQSIPEGSPSQEPTVQEIVSVFGYGTTITGSGQQLNRGGRVEAVGDEVLSPYWERADASRPVVVRELAAFHQQGQLDTLSTTNVATSANSPTNPPASQPRLSHDEADSQSLLPRTLDTLAPGKVEFSPAQPVFGFRVRDEWSDPRINRTGGPTNIDGPCLQARQADPAVRCGHHMRFWPAKDRAGATMANTWLMFMDYAGVNYDYQDNAYLVSNIRPHADGAPAVTASRPAAGATGVPRDITIATDLFLPSGGIDNSTLTPSTARLVRASDGAQVPATIGTSGGGDTVVLTPTVLLDASTTYRFEITSGLKDVAGNAFVPFTMTFTTGTGVSDPGGGSTGAQFEQVRLPSATGQYDFYTGLTMGPDGKLYAGMTDGRIRRFPVHADGTLGAPQTITSLQGANGGPRLLIGLHFDPAATAANLVLWTSHSSPGYEGSGRPDWGGKITRLSGPDLGTVQDVVVNLPRSARDHVTNGIDFGPDGALYFPQGSNSAMGAPDSAWDNRPERLLSAAVLRLDPAKVISPPLNAKTAEGGTYNPFAPGAPLTIFASGVRNAFDLVWHSNGRLYVPANGSAAGGNTPGTPSPLPASCQKRLDGAYTGPAVSAITGVSETQHDWLFRVEPGGYYGHPNPTRCEWVLNGGNPTSSTDPGQVSQYPVGTLADRNWRGAAYDFGLNKSPNGVVEYTSSTFGGALKGRLLVVRYSANDDIVALTPGGTSQDIVGARTGIPGMTQLKDPLDIVEDPRTGNLYVSEFDERGTGQRITLLRALDVVAPAGCAPYSTLSCGGVGAQPPFKLSWNGDPGGLGDRDGQGTGMTMVQPSSKGGAYRKELLDLDTAAGTLTIDATAGLQFTSTNSQDNALGVGLDAGNRQRIETTLLNPPLGTGASEQAGIWFGPDEDNYAKLVVLSSGGGQHRIQLLTESGAVSGTPLQVDAGDLSGTTVRLILDADPATGKITASYRIGSGADAQLGALDVPASLFDGTGVSTTARAAGVTGFAGIFASRRRSTAATPLKFAFGEFALGAESSGDDTQPTVTAVEPAGGAGDVSVDADVRATFSEAIDAPKLDDRRFFLTAGGTRIAADVRYDPAAHAAILDPAARLQPSTIYTATVVGGPAGVTDTAGNPLGADHTWTFRTSTLTAPPGLVPTPPRGSEGMQPRSPVRINAGGPSLQVGSVRWSGCASTHGCRGWVRGGTPRKVSESRRIARPVPPAGAALYRSHWTGGASVRKGDVAFTYDVPVGKGSFTVRLHFAELRRKALGDRVFDVGIEGGAPELVAFDPVAEAGGDHRAVVREFPVRTEDGRVTIRFRRRSGMPMVSGIEVLPRAKGADAPVAGSVALAARSSTRAGRPVTLLSGRLVAGRTLDARALAGKPLLVERRRRGGGYRPVRMTKTRSGGRFDVALLARPGRMLYRVRFAGDGDVGPSTSRRVASGPE